MSTKINLLQFAYGFALEIYLLNASCIRVCFVDSLASEKLKATEGSHFFKLSMHEQNN